MKVFSDVAAYNERVMAMAGYLFRRGRLSLYDTLCVKAEDGRAGLPLTREEWYDLLPATLSLRKEAA